MLFQSGLGIYFKENSLCLSYLKGSFKTLNNAGQASYPLDPAKPLAERLRTAGGMIKDFISSNGVASPDIFIGIPRELTILRDLEFPLAVKENLRTTLEYKIENYVPLKLEDIYFDYQIIHEDKQKNLIKILLVVIKRDILDLFFMLKDRLGVGLTGIGISSTALVNFFSHHPQTADDKQYAFIHQDQSSLHLGVVKEGRLTFSRAVRIEQDMEIGQLLSGELKPVRQQLEGVEKPVKLFLCADSIKDFSGYLAEFEKDFQVETPDLSMTDIHSPAMVPAMGLALRGMRAVPMDINLLPTGMRKRPSRAAYYLMLVFAALFVITSLTWGGSQIMRQRLQLSQINEETEQLLSEIKNIDRIKADIENLEGRIEYLNNLWRGRVPVLEVLKETTEKIPENAWLQDFNYDEKGVQIYGYAESASDLIPLLEASPLFTDVVFLSTITKGKDGKERFRLGYKIKS